MGALESLGLFFTNIGQLIINFPAMLLLFGSVIMGIVFGATPGLTATLGVALIHRNRTDYRLRMTDLHSEAIVQSAFPLPPPFGDPTHPTTRRFPMRFKC